MVLALGRAGDGAQVFARPAARVAFSAKSLARFARIRMPRFRAPASVRESVPHADRSIFLVSRFAALSFRQVASLGRHSSQR